METFLKYAGQFAVLFYNLEKNDRKGDGDLIEYEVSVCEVGD